MIVLWSNEFPPSVNSLYFFKAGRFVLKTEGREWKNRFKAGRGNMRPARFVSLKVNRHGDFAILVWYFRPFDEVYNMGHESIAGYEKRDKRIRHRHKNWDDDGLIKVTKDATAELIGLNDRSFMTTQTSKRPIPPGGKEGVLIIVMELNLQNGEDPFEVDPDLLYAAIHGDA
jgi:hypothetical protein